MNLGLYSNNIVDKSYQGMAGDARHLIGMVNCRSSHTKDVLGVTWILDPQDAQHQLLPEPFETPLAPPMQNFSENSLIALRSHYSY